MLTSEQFYKIMASAFESIIYDYESMKFYENQINEINRDPDVWSDAVQHIAELEYENSKWAIRDKLPVGIDMVTGEIHGNCCRTKHSVEVITESMVNGVYMSRDQGEGPEAFTPEWCGETYKDAYRKACDTFPKRIYTGELLQVGTQVKADGAEFIGITLRYDSGTAEIVTPKTMLGQLASHLNEQVTVVTVEGEFGPVMVSFS